FEKLLVHLPLIESRHRPRIQSQRTGREDEIGPLERAIPKGRLLRQGFIRSKMAAHIGVRKKSWQMLVELMVHGDDGRDRRRLHLLHVQWRKARDQPLLPLGALDENN